MIALILFLMLVSVGNLADQEGNIAIQRLAGSEGILLDSGNTGKARAGLIDLTTWGFFKSDETMIFLNTGGAPGLFAFP